MKTAAILVGGKGTRLAGFLGETPKPLASVAGKPFVELLIERLSRAGVEKVVLLTGHKAEAFQKYENMKFGATNVHCIRENEPLGSAGALLNAKADLFQEDFLLLNGDTFLDIDYQQIVLLRTPSQFLASVGLCKVEDSSRYGTVNTLEDGTVTQFLEKGAHGPGMVNGGAFIIKKGLLETIEKVSAEKGVRFLSLEQDVFPILLAERNLHSYQISGTFIDIGIPESYCSFNVDHVFEKVLKESNGSFMAQLLIALFESHRILHVGNPNSMGLLFSFFKEKAFFVSTEDPRDPILKNLTEEDLVLQTGGAVEKVSDQSSRAQILRFSLKPQSGELDLSCINDNGWVDRLKSYFEDISKCRGLVQTIRALPKPGLFLDRDGVVIEYVPYIKDVADVKLRDGIDQVIRSANRQGVPVIIVTNQAGLEKGKYSELEFQKVQHKMLAELALKGAWIDQVFCARFVETGENYLSQRGPNLRKPRKGMLTKAAAQLNIDLAKSIFVGDSESDIGASLAAHLSKTYVVKSGVYNDREWIRLQEKYQKVAHFVEKPELLNSLLWANASDS